MSNVEETYHDLRDANVLRALALIDSLNELEMKSEHRHIVWTILIAQTCKAIHSSFKFACAANEPVLMLYPRYFPDLMPWSLDLELLLNKLCSDQVLEKIQNHLIISKDHIDLIRSMILDAVDPSEIKAIKAVTGRLFEACDDTLKHVVIISQIVKDGEIDLDRARKHMQHHFGSFDMEAYLITSYILEKIKVIEKERKISV